MILNSIITKKYVNKLSNQWFNKLQVNQKIALGYTVALGVSVFGTILGVTIGNHQEEKALKQEEKALIQTTALHRLQTAVLQVRTHQQQLIPLSKQPKDFDEEYSHIVQHSEAIQKGWVDIQSIIQEGEEQHSQEEIAKLSNLVKSYKGIPEQYLKSLNRLVQEVRLLNLGSSANITAAQVKILEFTNSELAIKFDGISDDLTDIIKLFYLDVQEAKSNVRKAIILRNYITFSSVFISIIIAVLLGQKISKAISSPILELNKFSKQVTESGDFDLQASITTEDEIGSLTLSFNHLISRVKQLLEEQKANTANLKAIIDNLADGLLVSDKDGQIINYNPTITNMFGLGNVDIKGLYCREFIPELSELLSQTWENPTAIFTKEIQPNDNQFIKASVTAITEANCIGNYCKCLGSVILVRDITQEKEVDRMKTDFISTVSHELRTPLTSVLGFASIIQEKLEENIFPLLPEENRKTKKTVRRVKDNINIIISEAERLTTLINDVLDIAKMEAGKLDWKQDNISIAKVIERSFAATSALFITKDLELVKNIEPDLPAGV